MFSRVKITKTGDTPLSVGDIVERDQLKLENERAKSHGGEEAETEEIILGISEVALSRSSFLSSASFQHTTRVLIDSALEGSLDTLKGLKENVIIGRLIPAGTGFEGSAKYESIKNLQREKELERSQTYTEVDLGA